MHGTERFPLHNSYVFWCDRLYRAGQKLPPDTRQHVLRAPKSPSIHPRSAHLPQKRNIVVPSSSPRLSPNGYGEGRNPKRRRLSPNGCRDGRNPKRRRRRWRRSFLPFLRLLDRAFSPSPRCIPRDYQEGNPNDRIPASLSMLIGQFEIF